MIELSDGWAGRIISTQLYFSAWLRARAPVLTPPDVLDGAMVTLAIYTLNVAHPGVLIAGLGGDPHEKSVSSDEV